MGQRKRPRDPKPITVLAIIVYFVCLALGVDLLYSWPPIIWAGWIPGTLLIAGSAFAIPTAWVGGPLSDRIEQSLLVLIAGGLATGTIIAVGEATSYVPGVKLPAAAHYTLALLIICLIMAVARWIQLAVKGRV